MSGKRPAGKLRSAAPSLSLPDARRYARLALQNLEREYPSKLDHVIARPEDVASPRALHPAFFGSFDWHSCVHGHWLLARLLKTWPELPEGEAIRSLFDAHLAPENIEREVDYLRRPQARSFERPYGWAWLLKLAEEIACWHDRDAHRWSRDLVPLAQTIVGRYLDWLPAAAYPVRHGVHSNTAFALAFAHDYARSCDAGSLREAVTAKAREWYAEDADAPAGWEPSGTDFLSPALIEADLMRRVLPQAELAAWLGCFLPGIGAREPASLFAPVAVADRSDPHIVHLDGLNLSRAWCWRAIAQALPPGDARIAIASEAAGLHLAAGRSGVGSGEYVGDHWLATFAVLAATT
jgi:Protein of unknown function (DUF2891)